MRFSNLSLSIGALLRSCSPEARWWSSWCLLEKRC